jgi:hypoxanthine phosphoribosyltransferase
MNIDVEMDFLAVSSYGDGTKSSGAVKITKDLDTDITGRSVLIIEDIIDSGLTLNFLVNHLATRYPAEIKTCSLLLRNIEPDKEPPLDYYGFKIPDHFVVGYGLDYAQKYRNLPYIGILEPADS